MSTEVLQAVIGVGGPAVALLTYLLGRRHRQSVEKKDSMSTAIEAVTDANMNITAIVQSLMAPMQEELKRVSEVEIELRAELSEVNHRVTDLDARFAAAISYIRNLSRMVRDLGQTPPAAPPELDGVDLHP